MRRAALLIALVLLLAGQGFTDSDTRSIVGRVVDPNGNPVPQATVRGPGNLTATSATDGTFLIQSLPPDTSSVVLSARVNVGDRVLFGLSGPIAVVQNGTADAGDITVDSVLGDGAQGTLVTSHAKDIVNVAHRLVQNVSAGATTLVVDGGAGLSVSGEVLVIQIQGTAAGTYEFATISGVSGSSLMTVAPLKNPFSATDGVTNVITVPHYTNITVSAGTSLTAAPWDGSTGGVVVLRATGGVTIEHQATISVKGVGFRGGRRGTSQGCGAAGGQRGESIRGFAFDYGNTAPFFGGGGAGGPDGCVGCDGDSPAGGGGYGTPGGNSVNPNSPAYAGLGGQPYGSDDLLQEIYLGSGGGESHWDGNPGGNGGGAILIFADHIDARAGSIDADGQDGSSSFDHPSGAGSGGSTLVYADEVIVKEGAGIHAAGGKGYESMPCLPCCGSAELEVGGAGGLGRMLTVSRESITASTEPLHGPRVSVDIVGSGYFRFGAVPTTQMYYVNYGNSGNEDPGPTAISIALPWVMSGSFLNPPGPVEVTDSDDGGIVLTTTVDSIPPGTSGTTVLRLTLTDPTLVSAHDNYLVTAWTAPPESVSMPSIQTAAAVVPMVSGALCGANCQGSSNECALRQRLASEGIAVNKCACPEACNGYCGPTQCGTNCTSISKIDATVIVRLEDLRKELSCDLLITGGSERDGHKPARGGCGHCQGFGVDLGVDASPCFQEYVDNECTPLRPITWTNGMTPWPRWKCDEPFGPGFVLTQESSPIHWDLKFFDNFGSVDDVFCRKGFDKLLNMITSGDPNEKVGPEGWSDARFIAESRPLHYSVFFENKADASAPAQTVVVTDVLDPDKVRLDTFAFGPLTFGDHVVLPPAGSQSFSSDVDLRPDLDLIARVTGSLDPATGEVRWTFVSIDPLNGAPTTDPFIGFLPPNVTPPEGQGSMLFTVQPRSGLTSGTVIRNQATIVFDQNAAIQTNVWENTIDATEPRSRILSLPATRSNAGFDVQWEGTDDGAGIKAFTIFVSDDNGPYTPLRQDVSGRSTLFFGELGHTYRFFSIAEDGAGNLEGEKFSAEATTTITAGGKPTAKCAGVTKPTDPGLCAAAASIDDGSFDDDGDEVTTSQTPPGPYPLGVTPVTLTAKDTEGLSDSCLAEVSVVDHEVPVLECPAPVVECASPAGVEVELPVAATDNCPGVGQTQCVPAAGSTFALGTTPFLCSVSDGSGNVGRCDSFVTVQDTVAPRITSSSARPNFLWPPDHRMVRVDVSVVASDICDPGPSCVILSVSSNEAPAPGPSRASADWTITGPLSVDLRAERSGYGNGRTYTLALVCADASGNTSNSTVEVRAPLSQGRVKQ